MLVAMTAVALGIAGAISTVQAGSKDDAEHNGGIKIGPFGQRFGGHHFRGFFAFAPLRHVRGMEGTTGTTTEGRRRD
jgi:hypothetical protein